MARRKAVPPEDTESATQRNSRKRDREAEQPKGSHESPTKRRPGRPPKVAASGSESKEAQTPSRSRTKNATVTPIKLNGVNGDNTPGRRTIADRSARRKSARALIDRVVTGATSDDEEGDEGLAREIYESSDSEEEEEAQEDGESEEEQPDVAVTPSKRPRGRPRKTPAAGRRKKSPTPPRDLPRHEQYFYQNKPGLAKTSNNNLTSLDLLTHDEYFALLHKHKDTHSEDVAYLESLHAESFPQWTFELLQGFSMCLYGYGSKRRLLHQFATYLHNKSPLQHLHRIVIVNGYVRTISAKEIMTTISSAVDPSHKLMSGNTVTMAQDLLALLSSHEMVITLMINSIDALPLRKGGVQSILAQLAAHPRLRLVCSADTPDFSLLWDTGLRSSFNFVFHDSTTFAPFTAEIDVVDEVHDLLGRKTRRAGGKEGVTFVLRSLPENARNLFRLLVTEVLVAMDEEGAGAGENLGVEYRMVYGKAVEEFICSSEMAFRTLLKEFHDHQIITSRKDILGTELLSLPFRKEELESILEDLMS